MPKTYLLGNCLDEALVEQIFGSVSEFARLDEKYGAAGFMYGDVEVIYDDDTDIHTFYQIEDD